MGAISCVTERAPRLQGVDGDFGAIQGEVNQPKRAWFKGFCGENGGPFWPIGLAAKCSKGAVQRKETLGRSGHAGPFS